MPKPAAKPATEAALEIMREWTWSFADPDGRDLRLGQELGVVVNRLAMEGIESPNRVLLSLLCDGRLKSRGSFQWEKAEGSNTYRREGENEPIAPLRWRILEGCIKDVAAWANANSEPFPTLELVYLGARQCAPFEWSAQEGYLRTASCGPASDLFTDDYFEEWFSAWDIEVWPRFLDEPDAPPEAPAGPFNTGEKRGGRPRKWDWDGALLHLAAKAHGDPNGLIREDGGEPNQSDIANHLEAWFLSNNGSAPESSQLREYGRRFEAELTALKMAAANNSRKGD